MLGAFGDSLKLLMMEHGIRISFQEKTRRELGGAFWNDYTQSVKIPHQWEDSDAWWVNYIGHPIHGAAAGYIWLDHEPGAPPDIGLTTHYWGTRGRAAAWSAVYSLQFEFGPLSEASIGNVGLRDETTGWVDHVVTPQSAPSAGSCGRRRAGSLLCALGRTTDDKPFLPRRAAAGAQPGPHPFQYRQRQPPLAIGPGGPSAGGRKAPPVSWNRTDELAGFYV